MKFFKKKKVEFKENSVPKIKTKYKIGLALSGGGARGFAHIGAIKAFEEKGMVFDYVAGTSAGSFVGAAYCAGYSAEEMIDFSNTFADTDIKNPNFFFVSTPASNIERVADRLLLGATFDRLKIPFRAVSVDLISGEEYVFSEGSVAKAVSASCAVPLVFKPVSFEGKLLADGGLLNTIPSDVVRRMGADFVIAVDINSTRGMGMGEQKTKFLNIATATWRIVMKSTAYRGLMNSDIIIKPDLTKFSSTQSLGRNDMIDIGYKAAIDSIEEIFMSLGIK
ncbi:MAG TPA: patatin-like phospholipase family protein [Clostridia bacterium]|nr:patatin-like phospholipase family protein [Clostridia bacterium]